MGQEQLWLVIAVGDLMEGECSFVVDITMMPKLMLSSQHPINWKMKNQHRSMYRKLESFGASGLADGFNAVYTITAKTSGLTVDFADGNLEEVITPELCKQCNRCWSSNSQPINYLRFISSGRTSALLFTSQVILESRQMWMVSGTIVTIASGAGDEVDATTSGYTHVFPTARGHVPSRNNVLSYRR